MKNWFTRGFGWLAAAMIVFSGCVPEFNGFDKETWNPEFGIPVVNATLTMEDILDSTKVGGYLKTDSSELVYIVYEDSAISEFGSSALEVNLPVAILSQNYQMPAEEIDGKNLKKIDFQSSKVRYTMENPYTEAVDVEVTLTNMRRESNNDPYSLAFTVPAASDPNTPLLYRDSTAETRKHLIRFPGKKFRTSYTATGKTSGQSLDMGEWLLEFLDIDYSYVEGYLGTDTISVASVDSIELDFLKKWEQGTVYFENPVIRMTIDNSYGTPSLLVEDVLKFTTHLDGEVDMTTELEEGILLEIPDTTEVGIFKRSYYEINNSNSNLSDVIAAIPYKFLYQFSYITNPDEDSTLVNFVSDGSQIKVQVEVEVPLYGRASGFAFSDTFDLSFDDLPEDLEKVGFKVITDNGFPIDLSVQVYFVDVNGLVLDSLFVESEPLIAAGADVDTDGKVIAPKTYIKNSSIVGDRLYNIRDNAKEVIVTSTLNTTNDGTVPVKIYSTYSANIRMGMSAGL